MRQIVIPARGGSKGCHRKNARKLLGEPLISRCVRICKEANVDRIVVTTEDAEIAGLADDAGAYVCERPPELATDDARSVDAVAHCVGQFRCDELAIAQCTSPFLAAQDIDGTFELLDAGIDLAICVLPFHGIVCDDRGPINYHPQQSTNRQLRPPQWIVSGHCWAMRPEYLMRPWMSGSLAFCPAMATRHLEIDTEDDWAFAEKILLDEKKHPF